METKTRHSRNRRASTGLLVLCLCVGLGGMLTNRTVAAGVHKRGAHVVALPVRVSHLTTWRALPDGLAPALGRALVHMAIAPGPGHGASATTLVSKTTWKQQAELTAPPNTARFGHGVAISGTTALVGAPSGDIAVLFVRNGTTWSQQAVITPTVRGGFGWVVALSGDTAVIGAPFTNDQMGAAYVFVRNGSTWSQQAQLSAAIPVAHNQFGISVAISGNTVVVGTSNSTASGAAYVFVRSGTKWSVQAKLTANAGGAVDGFGVAVAVSSNTALIADVLGTNGVGSAYVFVRSGSTWTPQAQLLDPNSMGNDGFGFAIALNGNTAAIGAYGQNTGGVYGAADLFVRTGTTWTQQGHVTAPSGAGGFGLAVALSGNTLVVGAYGTNGYAGSAYVYARSGTTWSQQAELSGSATWTNSYFGWAVAVSGSTALIGAYGVNQGSSGGAAYVFARG